MKYIDDRCAKFKIWQHEQRIAEMPAMPALFQGKKSFCNYAELNAWKRELQRQLAERGGVQWTLTRPQDQDDIQFLQIKLESRNS